jgi:hypothetical protein
MASEMTSLRERALAAASPTPPTVSLLALQFLAWVAAGHRTRADVMDAWRSTCPRQSVWEDSVIDGLVTFDLASGQLVLTPLGQAALLAASSPAAVHS